MPERDSFYLGALLHDIGKFLERAKLREWQNLADHYVSNGEASRNYAHRRYSAAFIDKFSTLSSFLPSDSITQSCVLWHHRGNEPDKQDYEPINNKGVLLKLIRMADDCASAERSEDASLEPQKYYLARLQSIFSEIIFSDDYSKPSVVPKPMYLGLEALSCRKTSMFPLDDIPAFNDVHPLPYKKPLEDFLDSFRKIQSDEELLFLIEKFCHGVPAQTPTEFNGKQHLSRPDINLFDHLRTTAAIALCLYDEWKCGGWNKLDAAILDDSFSSGYKNQHFPPPCILISADISGIQDFIFSIPSKGAAKSLKGRSFFVQLLAEVCAQLILDELDLKPVNLLYNGGGNFFILAPFSCQDNVEKCAKRIAEKLLQSDQNELYVTIAHVSVGIKDFQNFSEKWDEVKTAVNRKKRQKFQMLDAALVFDLIQQKARAEKDPFMELSRQLTSCEGYVIKKSEGNNSTQAWMKLFDNLGYQVEFGEKRDTLRFNNTNFEGQFKGFRFAVKELPVWQSQKEIAEFKAKAGISSEDDEERREPGNIKTFVDLARYAAGTPKIGVLKMDVDNLGKIFSDGLNHEGSADLRTPSRMMVLSRSLKWFFEGYMNTLLEKYKGELYPIFSGGDDFFLLGAWDKVFILAQDIKTEFQAFVARHPGITLSASLLVVDEHYPVARFAAIAEARLHHAKYGSLHKNSINVFGYNLTWNEFSKAKEIMENLSNLLNLESKAVIQKVLKCCDGLEVLHERALRYARAQQYGEVIRLSEEGWFNNQKMAGEKVWRMAYAFRDIKEKEPKAIAEKIISAYETAVFRALQGELVNPMYIAVGARWAELGNRKA